MFFTTKPAEVAEIEQAQRDFTLMLRAFHLGQANIDEVIAARHDIYDTARKHGYFVELCNYEWWKWQPWMEDFRDKKVS